MIIYYKKTLFQKRSFSNGSTVYYNIIYLILKNVSLNVTNTIKYAFMVLF